MNNLYKKANKLRSNVKGFQTPSPYLLSLNVAISCTWRLMNENLKVCRRIANLIEESYLIVMN